MKFADLRARGVSVSLRAASPVEYQLDVLRRSTARLERALEESRAELRAFEDQRAARTC